MAKTIGKEKFTAEVIHSDKPVLLDFYAEWCMPCKMLSPVIDQIADEATNAKVYKVNIDEEPELASQFQVMSVPTLVVMKDGKIANTMIGVQPKHKILNALNTI